MPERQAIILSIADEPAAGCAGGCGVGGACLPKTASPRVPVLNCRDALEAEGFDVELITACSDQEIDAVIARLDGPARPDGLTWPLPTAEAPVIIVASESDGQLRAVVRRMVRRFAPPPSRRPADLASGRTLPDLPAIAILPLSPAAWPAAADLADRLGLARDPADVAKAVVGGHVQRTDLFRNDSGSVTIHGALIGGVTTEGDALPWTGRVELDDLVLADGREPVIACAVVNANGYASIDELALAPNATAISGQITVAVAVPVTVRSLLGKVSVRVEVRRASGRAVSVTPTAQAADQALPFLDDGVAGTLTRKRSWWVEPGAWAVYTPPTAAPTP